MGLLSYFRPQRRFPPEEISQQRLQAAAAVRQYLTEHCIDILQLPQSFEVVPTVGGLESLVYFLEAEGFESVVIRLVQHRRRMHKRLAGHTLLRQVNAPVPAVLYSDLSRRTLRQYGWAVMVEERLSGVSFPEYPDPDQAMAMCGKVFGHIHSVVYDRQADYFTSPETRRWIGRDNVPRWMRRKTRQWLAAYRKTVGVDAEAVAAWLSALPDQAWQQGSRLCVGDVTAGNLLFAPHGLGIIDIYGVSFHSAAYEVARIKHRDLVAQADPAHYAAFLTAYRDSASAGLWEEIGNSLTLCHALMALRKAADLAPGEGRDRQIELLLQLVQGQHNPLAELEQYASARNDPSLVSI